jgi:hypothetical protein
MRQRFDTFRILKIMFSNKRTGIIYSFIIPNFDFLYDEKIHYSMPVSEGL